MISKYFIKKTKVVFLNLGGYSSLRESKDKCRPSLEKFQYKHQASAIHFWMFTESLEFWQILGRAQLPWSYGCVCVLYIKSSFSQWDDFLDLLSLMING